MPIHYGCEDNKPQPAGVVLFFIASVDGTDMFIWLIALCVVSAVMLF